MDHTLITAPKVKARDPNFSVTKRVLEMEVRSVSPKTLSKSTFQGHSVVLQIKIMWFQHCMPFNLTQGYHEQITMCMHIDYRLGRPL